MTAEQKKNRDNLGFAIIASRAAMAKIEHLMVCINQDIGLHIPGNPGEKFDDELLDQINVVKQMSDIDLLKRAEFWLDALERTRHDRLSRGWMMNSTQYGADYHIIFRELIDRFSKLSGI